MTRIQFVIILAIVAIIAIIAVPKALNMSRISQAERQILTIASAFAQYRTDTGQECAKIHDLIDDQGISGWMGPYIDIKIMRNPWGGSYEVDLKTKKVGIPKGDAAPDKYEFGGSEEISFSYSEDMYLG